MKQRCISLVVLLVTLFLMFVIWRERQNLVNVSKLGLLGIFLVNFFSSSTIVFPVPGATSIFFGGALWNPVLVGISAGLGATLGEVFGYLLGYGGGGVIKLRTSNNLWLKKISYYFHRDGFLTIFLISALPLPIFDVVGILAGSFNYPLYKFFVATLLGRTLRDIIIAWGGARIL